MRNIGILYVQHRIFILSTKIKILKFLKTDAIIVCSYAIISHKSASFPPLKVGRIRIIKEARLQKCSKILTILNKKKIIVLL